MTESKPQMLKPCPFMGEVLEALENDINALEGRYGQSQKADAKSIDYEFGNLDLTLGHLKTIRADLSRPHEDAPIADAGDNVKTNYELFDAVVSKVPFLVGRMIGQSDENERRLTSHEINALLLPVAHYLSALANNSIPAGWKLVPEEPTEEMLKAAWKDQYKFRGGEDDVSEALAAGRVRDSDQRAQDISAYRAMLAAAPQLREDR